MYEKLVGKIILEAPNFHIAKVFYKMTLINQFNGSIIVGKHYLAKELNVPFLSVSKAIKWLIENGYIETFDLNGVETFKIIEKEPEIKKEPEIETREEPKIENIAENKKTEVENKNNYNKNQKLALKMRKGHKKIGGSTRQYIPEE